jgi:hypothetical protein
MCDEGGCLWLDCTDGWFPFIRQKAANERDTAGALDAGVAHGTDSFG